MSQKGIENNQGESFLPTAKLNFIIGLCAMAISIASFYATYLQARSAELQVKAMTYPLIQFGSSNYDTNNKERIISLTLHNNGVGPALIKKISYMYEGESYSHVYAFLAACCDAEHKLFNEVTQNQQSIFDAQIITSKDRGVIVPVNERVNVLSILRHESNQPLWDRLNEERRKLSIRTCYCSLIDDCYTSSRVDDIEPVSRCD